MSAIPEHMNLPARFDGDNIAYRHVAGHALIVDVVAQGFRDCGCVLGQFLREIFQRFILPCIAVGQRRPRFLTNGLLHQLLKFRIGLAVVRRRKRVGPFIR